MSTVETPAQPHSPEEDMNVDLPLLCANRMAMALGLLRAVPLMLTTLPTLSGKSQPAARDCMAPMEEPTLA